MMAMTTYEGQLSPTRRWPEAEDSFSHPAVQSLLRKMIWDLHDGKACLLIEEDEIFISVDPGCWIRINVDGTIELGESAA